LAGDGVEAGARAIVETDDAIGVGGVLGTTPRQAREGPPTRPARARERNVTLIKCLLKLNEDGCRATVDSHPA
jgi:hypothetical protein